MLIGYLLVNRLFNGGLIFSSGACPTLCNGNGNIVRGHCQCHHGWKGQECDVREDDCEVPNCNANGNCVESNCACYPGFTGVDCGEGKLLIG